MTQQLSSPPATLNVVKLVTKTFDGSTTGETWTVASLGSYDYYKIIMNLLFFQLNNITNWKNFQPLAGYWISAQFILEWTKKLSHMHMKIAHVIPEQ